MADPNIQTLIFPVNTSTPGVVKTYTAEVNKKTGAMVVYDTTNIGQKDPVIRNDFTVGTADPVKKWRSDLFWNPEIYDTYIKRPIEERTFLHAVVEPQAINQRAAFINKNYTQAQKNNLFSGMPKVQNTAPPNPLATPGGENPKDTTVVKNATSDLKPINVNVGTAKVRKEYGNYYYPEDLKNNGQDRIIFTMKTSEGSTINPTLGQQNVKRKEGGVIGGSVILPIQPSISDSNSVDWQGNNLNAMGAFAASSSLKLMSGKDELAKNIQGILGKAAQSLRENKDYGDALKIYLAQEAVGLQGLLSRAGGAILNPNMELLFNAPSLRPFTFTFRLSPRSSTEATQVKNIIRFFKQGMSVKTTGTSVFLKAPNVFDIKYQTYDENKKPITNHPSLNRIKTCALTACDVNYTPDGTYMTFDDGTRTMTSYELSLRFTELDPVYDEDYTAIDSDPSGDGAANQIGY